MREREEREREDKADVNDADNGIGAEGAGAIAGALRLCPQLQQLAISSRLWEGERKGGGDVGSGEERVWEERESREDVLWCGRKGRGK